MPVSHYGAEFMNTRENTLGHDLMTSGILLTLAYALGNEPTIINACVRLVVWYLFITLVIRTEFLWKPGPISWAIFTFIISWGTWPFFFITGQVFFPETQSYRRFLGMVPETGFAVNQGVFVFMIATWLTFRVGGPQYLFRLRFGKPIASPATTKPNIFVPIAMICVGILANALQRYVPGVLIQPLLLLTKLPYAGFALLISHGSQKVNRAEVTTSVFRTFLFVFATGAIGFLSSGLKGALIISLAHFAWYVGDTFPFMRRRMLMIAVGTFLAFVFFLPALDAAKNAYHKSRTSSAALKAVIRGLTNREEATRTYATNRAKPIVEATWEYFSFRLCTAGMTRKYFDKYHQHPRGLDSLWISIRCAVPRLLDPNKPSSSYYYEGIAVAAGIGSKKDRTTSKKPSFVEEAIVIFGGMGFVVGGVMFGVFLVLVEQVLSRIEDPEHRRIARFASATVGQLPYVAVMVGGTPYILIFLVVVLPILCRYCISGSANVRFAGSH